MLHNLLHNDCNLSVNLGTFYQYSRTCSASTTSVNIHNITVQTCTLLLCLILQQTSSCMVKGCLNGGQSQHLHNYYFISKHFFELLLSTIIVICHCYICIPNCKEFRRDGGRGKTNCPFISCKGMKKIGHLICQDDAAALDVSC